MTHEELKAYKKNWYRRNIDKVKAYNEKIRDKRMAYSRAYSKKYREELAEKSRISRRKYPEKHKDKFLKSRFGISLKEYNDLSAKQNHVCDICGNKEKTLSSTGKKIRALSVDHCHKTGKVRGLLCASCNTGIGKFADDIKLLQSAINYLLKHGS